LRKALGNIGIGKQEARERGLHLHAWRHFLNTELQKAGMTVQIVRAVTGHKSERMTEYYTHFNPMEFGEVPEIQAALLAKKPEAEKACRPALALARCRKGFFFAQNPSPENCAHVVYQTEPGSCIFFA
jgi:hypothetical protein